MTVLIDDRAGSADLVKYPPLDKLGVLTRLDSADIAFSGNGPDGAVLVGVEVKSVWDLLSSSNTGRLQGTQIPAMLKEYDVSWLLSHGVYRASARDYGLLVQRRGRWKQFSIGSRPVPYGYLESLLIDVVLTGVKVKHVLDIREAATWIGVLYRWWSKPWGKHKGMRTFDRSREVSLMPGVDGGMLVRARVAAQLPGLGFERAVAAARYFPSIADMMNATAKEWAEVPGIGKVIADAAVVAIRTKTKGGGK